MNDCAVETAAAHVDCGRVGNARYDDLALIYGLFLIARGLHCVQVVVPCLDETVSESFSNALACAERPLMPSLSLSGFKIDWV